MSDQPQLFTPTDDQVVLRTTRGVYKQAKLARRGKHFYAHTGGGYVLLYSNGVTSSDAVRWEYIENFEQCKVGKFGRLEIAA